VQIARVFAQLWDEHEALLLVDEPLTALDPGLQFRLLDALVAFAGERSHALIAVVHDVKQALAAFNRLWLMRGNRVIADLSSDRSAVAPIEALYGIGLRCIEDADSGLVVVPRRRPASQPLPAASC
jgi:iron complex transport system ATP-binding protein